MTTESCRSGAILATNHSISWKRHCRAWGGYVVFWLVVGCTITLIADLTYAEIRAPFDPSWWERQLAFWGLFIPFTPIVVRMSYLVQFSGSTIATDLRRLLGAGLLFVLGHQVLVGSARHLRGGAAGSGGVEGWLETTWAVMQSAWLLEVVVFVLASMSAIAVVKSRRLRENELEAETLRRNLAEARVAWLQLQLRPHFLFNTLHAIGVFAETKPKEARRMIALLGDLLRATLESGECQERPLRAELAFLDTFLEIQRIRFSDRLEVVIDVPEEALECDVPTLVLQPLVENALVHGVEKRSGAGHVRVLGEIDEDWLTLRVIDNGGGLDGDAPREGVGVGNTRERMRILYGDRQQLSLRPHQAGGVEAIVRIPRGARR